MLTAESQMFRIKENTAEIINEEELMQKLKRSVAENRPLRCKMGIDPSAPDIHIGHAVVLRKLKTFQDLGHHVIIILGDFTGRIGDPTERSETRKQLSEEEVLANAETYKEQIFKILDRDKTELVYNSKWLGSLSFTEVIEMASTYTVARMLEREDFARRYRENLSISIHEFFYPLMQGYDSVAISADIEFGATEQKFNLLMGRHLQREYGQEPQVALTMPILVGTDGVKKMSKSLGNYVGISEPPGEIYGKLMSIPDSIIPDYFRLATGLSADEVNQILGDLANGNLHPRDAKMRLAREVLSLYHEENEVVEAEERFRQVFQKGMVPEDIPVFTFKAPSGIVFLMVRSGLASSNSEARRLIEQGGVRVNDEKVDAIDLKFKYRDELVMQVGKRKFARIKLN